MHLPKKVSVLLNWVLYIAMVTVNGMANGLPINGLNTAQVSDKYPNLFVPAGYTFSIWGLIYLLLLLHVIYSTYILLHEKRCVNCIGKVVNRLNPLFWLSCIFNISWILAWHYLYIQLSVVIMLGLFITLFKAFTVVTVADKEIQLGYMEHISLETPFIIYFSWIAVALIANVTALLVSMGFSPGNEAGWSSVMIAVAALIGIVFSVYFLRPAYTAVIMWAVLGIYNKHASDSESIATTALTALAACLLAAIFGFWRKRKLLFRPSVQTE